MQGRDDFRERNEQDRRWHQVGQKNADAELFAERTRQPRQRVSGRNREQQSDQHHDDADEDRVPDPAGKQRLFEEDLEVLHRRRRVV